MANMLHGVTSSTTILTAFTVELLLYEPLHYRRAVKLFTFLDDLLVVQPLTFQVLHSKVSYRSCYYEAKFPNR